MLRLFLIIAALPIIATFLLRWWFGIRIISSLGRTQCACNLDKWQDTFGTDHTPPSKNADAIIFAELLHKTALTDWKTREPKAAASREGVRRFGMAVPPLSLMCGLLGFIVGRLPIMAVIVIFLSAIACAAVFSFLSIAPELKALFITSRRLRDARIFPRSDDESAVLRTATALAWKKSAPPIFNLIQP